jgi:hypothetical protein
MQKNAKTEKLIHFSEYTSPEWYEQQLAQDWYFADMEGEYMIMRKMSENGYGDITAQQASIMKYATIWELNKSQLQVLLGKDYKEEAFKDWEQRRQKPLEEYKAWASGRV